MSMGCEEALRLLGQPLDLDPALELGVDEPGLPACVAHDKDFKCPGQVNRSDCCCRLLMYAQPDFVRVESLPTRNDSTISTFFVCCIFFSGHRLPYAS